ncbi:MAG: hypothetical protein JO235_22500 [Chroococcidiopsidaceae cyanobacterium CP_BM_RX_35]|nr:hypothetical protein [Chroococcidiopsidaceae cyanobacterium CP_BM_RX_35]
MVLSKQDKSQDLTVRPEGRLDNSPGPKGVPPQVKILQMMNAYRLSQSISVAAKLGIADFLADGPKSSDELARSTGVHAQSLYRLLRALASFGVFAEDENGLFGLTPRAAMLQTNVPGSIRAYAIVIGEEWHWRMWGDIAYSVKTGEPAFDHLFGMEFQNYYSQHPEVAKNFDGAMVSVLAMTDAAVMTNYNFSSIGKVVDVGTGGGDGKLIASILKTNPNMQGVFFDLPPRLEPARALIEAEELTSRCELVAGDVFKSFPSGGDAYIIKNLIHDYDDERAVTILKNCHEAIEENGKLLVVEMVLPPGNKPSLAKILDVEALIMTAGAIERTEAQYRELFETAGFKLTNVISTSSPMSILEAVPM